MALFSNWYLAPDILTWNENKTIVKQKTKKKQWKDCYILKNPKKETYKIVEKQQKKKKKKVDFRRFSGIWPLGQLDQIFGIRSYTSCK